MCLPHRTVIGDGSPKFDEGLKSAASTLASIVSRQAFDIPRKASDSDDSREEGNDDSGGRFSLPEIGNAGGGNVGSGAFARRDTPVPRGRDPFGSPVSPLIQHTYNGFGKHHAGNNTRTAANAAAETATYW